MLNIVFHLYFQLKHRWSIQETEILGDGQEGVRGQWRCPVNTFLYSSMETFKSKSELLMQLEEFQIDFILEATKLSMKVTLRSINEHDIYDM